VVASPTQTASAKRGSRASLTEPLSPEPERLRAGGCIPSTAEPRSQREPRLEAGAVEIVDEVARELDGRRLLRSGLIEKGEGLEGLLVHPSTVKIQASPKAIA